MIQLLLDCFYLSLLSPSLCLSVFYVNYLRSHGQLFLLKLKIKRLHFSLKFQNTFFAMFPILDGSSEHVAHI